MSTEAAAGGTCREDIHRSGSERLGAKTSKSTEAGIAGLDCRGYPKLQHTFSYRPLEVGEAERVRIVECRVDTTTDGLVGVRLFDVHGSLQLVSVELTSGHCHTSATLASCFINRKESYLILKAAVADLREGETRTYECEANYLSGGKEKKQTVRQLVILQDDSRPHPVPQPVLQSTNSPTAASTRQSTHTRGTDIPSTLQSQTPSTQSTSLPGHIADSHNLDPARGTSVDAASVAIGASLTLILAILVLVGIFLWRRRRQGRTTGLYPRFSNSHQAFNFDVISLDQFPIDHRKRLPRSLHRSWNSVSVITDTSEAESLAAPPVNNRPQSSGQRSIQIRRHRPGVSARGDAQHRLRSLYLTPAIHDHRLQVQRPLPDPQQRSSEMVETRRPRVTARPPKCRARECTSVDVHTLAPPSRHAFRQSQPAPRSDSDSSPYMDLS